MLAGTTDASDVITEADILLVKIQDDGDLETGFGDGGFVQVDTGGYANFDVRAFTLFEDSIYTMGISNASNLSYLIKVNMQGEVDEGYGVSGFSDITVSTVPDLNVSDLIFSSEGSAYAVGGYPSGTDLFALKLNTPFETFDLGFAGDGLWVSDLGGGNSDALAALAQTPDGGFVAVGYGMDVDAVAREAALVKFDANGDLDTSFGDDLDGMVSYDFSDSANESTLMDVIVDDAGSIYAVGTVNNSSTSADMVVAKFLPDGTLDTSFSDDGFVYFDFTAMAYDDYGYSIGFAADGDLLIGGQSILADTFVDALTVLKLSSDTGTIDASFADAGIWTYDVSDYDFVYDLLVDTNGRIYVLGQVYDMDSQLSVMIARLDSDGVLDSTFGGGAGFIIQSDEERFNSSVYEMLLDDCGGLYALATHHQNADGIDDPVIYKFIVDEAAYTLCQPPVGDDDDTTGDDDDDVVNGDDDDTAGDDDDDVVAGDDDTAGDDDDASGSSGGGCSLQTNVSVHDGFYAMMLAFIGLWVFVRRNFMTKA